MCLLPTHFLLKGSLIPISASLDVGQKPMCVEWEKGQRLPAANGPTQNASCSDHHRLWLTAPFYLFQLAHSFCFSSIPFNSLKIKTKNTPRLLRKRVTVYGCLAVRQSTGEEPGQNSSVSYGSSATCRKIRDPFIKNTLLQSHVLSLSTVKDIIFL